MTAKATDFEKHLTRQTKLALGDLLTAEDWARDRNVPLVVRTVLENTDRQDLADKIGQCRDGQFCSSLYCKKCRGRLFKGLHENVQTRFTDTLRGNEKRARKRFRFATVLLDVLPYDAATVKAALEEARKQRNKLSRKLKDKNVWMRGAFELEPIDFSAWDQARQQIEASGKAGKGVNAALRKYQTLLALADKKGRATKGRAVVVHFHGLIDCGTADPAEIKKIFHQEYGVVPKAVDLKQLYANVHIEKNLKDMSGYMVKGTEQKHWRRYKIGWTTNETRAALRELGRMDREIARSERGTARDDPDEGHVPPTDDELNMNTLGDLIFLDHEVFGSNPKSRHIGLG